MHCKNAGCYRAIRDPWKNSAYAILFFLSVQHWRNKARTLQQSRRVVSTLVLNFGTASHTDLTEPLYFMELMPDLS
jgi:hypothetical protein